MQHGTLIPRAPKLSPAAIVMAVVVHCLLVAGLWFGVSWQPKPEQPAAKPRPLSPARCEEQQLLCG